MQITVTSADAYFSTNFFGKDSWSAISPTDKALILATAETDILTYLSVQEEVPEEAYPEEAPFSWLQCAIFEWALFIHGNKPQIAAKLQSGAVSADVSAVQVDGLGREERGRYSQKQPPTTNGYLDLIRNSPAGRYLVQAPTVVQIVR